MTTRPYHLKTFYRTPLTYPENFKISILVVTCGFIGCGCLSHCFSLLGQFIYSMGGQTFLTKGHVFDLFTA